MADWEYTVIGVKVKMWHAEFVKVMVPLQITETIRFPADCDVYKVFRRLPITMQVLMTPTASQLIGGSQAREVLKKTRPGLKLAAVVAAPWFHLPYTTGGSRLDYRSKWDN
eukprot:CAMPEP_0197655522 /NCGR_PEP_ID=MMETSP1338-20131121/39498_1 /TAXON_ID=43686 ORGANISM="Pelagodinium beii, Strain RCC1491" /NCGR_SAMPLE_ID=MMETSP1338 /ASSEMBLY_ACC=CAM_ASM_000754 /LENGTH=110 /DNA_ID=CAMNT_0043231175 /DNA_START=251 /DNA_END=582 /DNA_ORIENTATION=-